MKRMMESAGVRSGTSKSGPCAPRSSIPYLALATATTRAPAACRAECPAEYLRQRILLQPEPERLSGFPVGFQSGLGLFGLRIRSIASELKISIQSGIFQFDMAPCSRFPVTRPIQKSGWRSHFQQICHSRKYANQTAFFCPAHFLIKIAEIG